MHRQHPAEQDEADAQSQALQGEQHHKNEINLTHTANLIRRPADSTNFRSPERGVHAAAMFIRNINSPVARRLGQATLAAD
jgi:hypothetical protein